jgi:hypothetical protein
LSLLVRLSYSLTVIPVRMHARKSSVNNKIYRSNAGFIIRPGESYRAVVTYSSIYTY